MVLMVTVGFPRMHKEAGERRDFLPDSVRSAAGMADVCIEHEYGSGMGYDTSAYGVPVVSHEEALSKDYVVVVRAPEDAELALMRSGSTSVSMLHPRTHPGRMALLEERGISGVSLDEIVGDEGNRLVENLSGCAWYATEVAFAELMKFHPDAYRPIHVAVMGPGRVGRHAVEAASKYGDPERNRRMMEEKAGGVTVHAIGRNVTGSSLMAELLQRTDILVDCTQRKDPSLHIVRNHFLSCLPQHAVILDIAADPYNATTSPPLVKAIEGIPAGNLDQYVFYQDDPVYGGIPGFVRTANRRIVASCYSWPGLRPEECMELYGRQILPIMEIMLSKGFGGISPNGSYHERAITRGVVR